MYNIHSHFIHIKKTNQTVFCYILNFCSSLCLKKKKRQSEHIPAGKLLGCCLATFRSCTSDSGDGEEGARLFCQSVSFPPPGSNSSQLNVDRLCFQSVRVHMAGVGPLLLGLVIHPQEVFVARGTAHPGLPKPYCPGEEELPLSGPHPTLQGHPDVAHPAAYPHTSRGKDLGLLSVKAADLHSDRGVLFLLIHLPNAAPCRYGKKKKKI